MATTPQQGCDPERVKVNVLLRTIGDLIKPEVAKLTTREVTLFWDRLYELAGDRSVKAGLDRKALAGYASAMNHMVQRPASERLEDSRVAEALMLAEEIEEMAGRSSWGDADSVAEKAKDIAGTIEEKNRVSSNQLNALRNMHAALVKWEQDDIPY